MAGLLEDRSPNVTQSTAGLGTDDLGAAGRWPGRAWPGWAQRCPILEGTREHCRAEGRAGHSRAGHNRAARPCPAQPRLYLGVGAQL